MSSARIRANRRNAKLSTGPRSQAGKKRVAQNAVRHGLAVPIAALPELNATAAKLALLMAGPAADQDRIEIARRAAEAEVDLRRVRTARLALLQEPIRDPNYLPARTARERNRIAIASLKRVNQVEQLRRLGRLSQNDLVEALAELQEVGESRPRLDKTERFAAAIGDFSQKLITLDRYERRALSRRKVAIRTLDALPTRSPVPGKQRPVNP